MDWKEYKEYEKEDLTNKVLRIDSRDYKCILQNGSEGISAQALRRSLSNKGFSSNINNFLVHRHELDYIIERWREEGEGAWLSIFDNFGKIVDMKYINVIEYKGKFLVHSGRTDSEISKFLTRETLIEGSVYSPWKCM